MFLPRLESLTLELLCSSQGQWHKYWFLFLHVELEQIVADLMNLRYSVEKHANERLIVTSVLASYSVTTGTEFSIRFKYSRPNRSFTKIFQTFQALGNPRFLLFFNFDCALLC